MASTKSPPIIIIKKVSGHGGHHGGAWKVAYADFVTAMMALFIVLWLMNSSDKVKKAVAGYFNDPKGTASLLGTTMAGNGVAVTTKASDNLTRLKEKLEEEVSARKELEKLSKQIEITITSEGLRIELIEDKDGTFYQTGSARLSESGQELLALLAAELKTLPNALLIEGHTDATPYSSDTSYGNWELSADRANSARRLLQQDGVRANQVTQVRGYADQLLRVQNNPYDPSNRRISILVKNDGGILPDLKNAAAEVVRKEAPRADGPPQMQNAAAPASHGDGRSARGLLPDVSVPNTSAAATKPPSKRAGSGLLARLKGMLPGAKK